MLCTPGCSLRCEPDVDLPVLAAAAADSALSQLHHDKCWLSALSHLCANKALNEVGHHAQVKGLVDRMVDADGELWWKIRWRGYLAADDTWETSGSTSRHVGTYVMLTFCTPTRPQGESALRSAHVGRCGQCSTPVHQKCWQVNMSMVFGVSHAHFPLLCRGAGQTSLRIQVAWCGSRQACCRRLLSQCQQTGAGKRLPRGCMPFWSDLGSAQSSTLQHVLSHEG